MCILGILCSVRVSCCWIRSTCFVDVVFWCLQLEYGVAIASHTHTSRKKQKKQKTTFRYCKTKQPNGSKNPKQKKCSLVQKQEKSSNQKYNVYAKCTTPSHVLSSFISGQKMSKSHRYRFEHEKITLLVHFCVLNRSSISTCRLFLLQRPLGVFLFWGAVRTSRGPRRFTSLLGRPLGVWFHRIR